MSNPHLALKHPDRPEQVRSALGRYRVMAFVTGGFLLLLCLEMIMKYAVRDGKPWLGSWVSIAHGWIYVVYLACVIDLWTKLQASIGKLVSLVLAGVVPFLSFVEERRMERQVRAILPPRETR